MEITLKQAVYMLLSEINQMDDIERDISEEAMIEEVTYYLASLSATCPFKNYAMEDVCPIKDSYITHDCEKYKSSLIGEFLNISCVDYEEEETAFIWEEFIKVAE